MSKTTNSIIITDKPATVWHIAQAMKCLANPELKKELRGIDFEKSEELGANILMLLVSHPDEIITALYYLNREAEDIQMIKNIDDGEDLAKLIEAIVKNNQNNVSTFMSFLGKALNQAQETEA